jgi:hypothetical protein
MKILCKTCYFRWRFEKEDWCKIIENEGCGSIKADKTKCDIYLKRGMEPKWLCYMCGNNTYGESSVSGGGKHYCSDCHSKKEHKEWLERERIKKLENIKRISNILGGDEKTAKKIIKTLI